MRSWLWGLGWGPLVLAACSEPSLDVPRAGHESSQLELEPPSELGAVPRLFRARLRDSNAADPWLFEGELSPYHDQAVRRGEVASTLRERAQPLRFWRADGWLWLQPLRWLEPGAVYTVALPGQGKVAALTISDEHPEIERVFPLASSRATNVTVLCSVPEADTITEVMLQPGSVPLRVSQGVAGVERDGCITLRGDDVASPQVLPPLLNGALMPPQTLGPSVPKAAASACAWGQMLAEACVDADDDRLFVTSPSDSLWLLQSPVATILSIAAGKRTELLRGLEPRQLVHLAGQVLTLEGEQLELDASVRTAAARRHLVLNEVLANPRGAEPESEWIELVNDSDEPATLGGLWLDDGSESVPLPPETIAAGELVLLVPTGFRASSLDVPVGDVRRIELPSLGARGLANGGEALLLVGSEGVVSRFPSIASSQAGRSIARRSPSSADDDAAAFAPSAAPGASPGAPNTIEP